MELKTCKHCKTERTLKEFRTRLSQKDKSKRIYLTECKPCYNERIRNSEKAKIDARNRQRKQRIKDPERFRGYELKKRHKITLDIYNKKLEEQNGVCAICKTTGTTSRLLTVDHDHSCCVGDKSCGKCLRGLLCTTCNSGLGGFRDDIEKLKSAILYLETVMPGEWTYQ